MQRALALQPTQPGAAGRLWQQVDRAAVLPIDIGAHAVVTSRRVGNCQAQPLSGVLIDQLWVTPSGASSRCQSLGR